MRLPGFTADASLYRKDARYQAAAHAPATGEAGAVTPQEERRRTWISCQMYRYMGRSFFCCINHYTGEYQCSDISTF